MRPGTIPKPLVNISQCLPGENLRDPKAKFPSSLSLCAAVPAQAAASGSPRLKFVLPASHGTWFGWQGWFHVLEEWIHLLGESLDSLGDQWPLSVEPIKRILQIPPLINIPINTLLIRNEHSIPLSPLFFPLKMTLWMWITPQYTQSIRNPQPAVWGINILIS